MRETSAASEPAWLDRSLAEPLPPPRQHRSGKEAVMGIGIGVGTLILIIILLVVLL